MQRTSIRDRSDILDAIDAILQCGNICEIKTEGAEMDLVVVEIFRKVKVGKYGKKDKKNI